jgi:hypothetical protein
MSMEAYCTGVATAIVTTRFCWQKSARDSMRAHAAHDLAALFFA